MDQANQIRQKWKQGVKGQTRRSKDNLKSNGALQILVEFSRVAEDLESGVLLWMLSYFEGFLVPRDYHKMGEVLNHMLTESTWN